jgi:hypothetical protein
LLSVRILLNTPANERGKGRLREVGTEKYLGGLWYYCDFRMKYCLRYGKMMGVTYDNQDESLRY